jgi:5,6-dimethylbenzimidazole synthase
MTPFVFSTSEKDAIHRLFVERRDVRQGFTGGDLSEEVLKKILKAAHHAPSVGYMQPWNFVIIRSQEKRQKIYDLHLKSREKESQIFSGDRRNLYKSLKLEGIRESTLNICVTCDRSRAGEVGLGRSQQESMDLYSTVCAVQNMWLAARAEDIGMGWVSIVNKQELAAELSLPDSVEVVAYLCLGPVEAFAEIPELEKVGWDTRRDLDDLIYQEEWGQS